MNVHANGASSAVLLMRVKMVSARRQSTYTMLQTMLYYQALLVTTRTVTQNGTTLRLECRLRTSHHSHSFRIRSHFHRCTLPHRLPCQLCHHQIYTNERRLSANSLHMDLPCPSLCSRLRLSGNIRSQHPYQ